MDAVAIDTFQMINTGYQCINAYVFFAVWACVEHYFPHGVVKQNLFGFGNSANPKGFVCRVWNDNRIAALHHGCFHAVLHCRAYQRSYHGRAFN